MSPAFPNTMAMRFMPSSNTPTLTSDVRIASAAAIASCRCMLFMNASIACLSPVFNACVCIFIDGAHRSVVRTFSDAIVFFFDRCPYMREKS